MTSRDTAPPSESSIVGRPETVRTDDGVDLAATRYRPSGEPRAALLVAAATAVPQGYYRRFAQAAAEAGFETLTFDYRGIAASAPERLRGYRMSFADWAEHDIPAAVAALDGSGPVHVVGHSYGGSAFGLVPQRGIASLTAYGAGTGWHGWMPRSERLRVLAMWHLIGPLTTAALGYLPWSRFFGGADLPLGAYRGWKRWVSFPRFAVDDPRMPDAAERYAAVRVPITSITATDDRWATPRSRDALAATYSGAEIVTRDVAPADLGVSEIGHMGYFRPAAAPLWRELFARLGG